MVFPGANDEQNGFLPSMDGLDHEVCVIGLI